MPGARITNGERVTLRTVEQEDIPFIQRGCTNPEIRYPLGTPLRNQDQIEEQHEDGDEDQFLVCLGDDAGPGQPDEDDIRRIGVISVEDADWRRPELGYWLVPEVHGDGYGKEAVSLVIDYVFRVYDHPAVGAGAYDFNDASRGLLESLGFSEEGRIRKDRFIDGEYIDTVQYGLLRWEWREQTRT
jgi:ribosomal-protein-alanine N-acetyltransferase